MQYVVGYAFGVTLAVKEDQSGTLCDVAQDLRCIAVWRKDRVEAGLDASQATDEGEPLDEILASD